MQVVNIQEVKPNKNNPRIIKDYRYKKLLKSIKEFPEMLKLRPIVVNNNMVVLGGNMRLKACKEAGLKEVWILKADDLTEEQQKEFIIKDNVGFGEWEYDMLGNEWDLDELDDWGLLIPSFNEDINYDPILTPSFDGKQLTEEQYEKKKQELETKNLDSNKSFISCLCPKCFHEFEVEKK